MASKVRESYTYLDADGVEQTIRINAASKREADMKFQQMILLMSGKNTTPTKHIPTVEEFIAETYRPTFMTNLKPTTRENYEQFLANNIVPFMGQTRIDEVNVATVQAFQNWMATASTRGRKKDLNADTITRVCGFAGRIFKVAAELKIIDESPFKSTLLKNPGEKAGHHKALPDVEIDRIIKEIPAMADPREQMYMALLACAGMRKQELLGLRWEDLNIEEGYGIINRAVTYPDNSKPHVDTPKSETSSRVILLTDPLLGVLKANRKDEGYLLGGENPLCYSTSERLRRAAFKTLGINFDNHDFRTTFGTRLKEAGLTSALVADVLGHADTRMVEKVYAPRRVEGVLKNREAIQRLNAG